jgi:hypothetical protein
MKKLISLSLILILFSGFFTGCKKDKGDPPVLPPAESMTIDFSNFDSAKKSSDQLPGSKGTENSNYDFAVLVAGYWKVIINTTLLVPVTAFQMALDQTPVYVSDKNWQWTYSVTIAQSTYHARLTGQIMATDVAWKMYVSKEGTGSFNEFVWFEGTSKLDGTGGQWILNQSAAVPSPLIQIDWTRTGSSIGTVKYTYVKSPDNFNSSYIEYGLTNNSLNAYYTIHYYNGIKFSEVNIEWNTSTHIGRVKCVDYLGDGTKWYCWNANKINDVCP